MAVNVNIYSNANAVSKSVGFDFVGDVLAAQDEILGVNTASYEYYFKLTTGARQEDGSNAGLAYPAKVVRNLSELALNSNVQSASNTSNAYGDIKSMIVDYTYDYINGHTTNQYNSGCTRQYPMKF